MSNLILDNENLANVGEEAPDFTLLSEQGEEWSLSEKRGQVVALLFYPGDETLVCTKQMCSLRDHWAEYVATGAEIVGISPGTMEVHRRFSQHHNLPIHLLADTDSNVTTMYSHHWWMPTRITRAIVVIDASGIVRSRKVMLRAFRPMDKEVIVAIRYAQQDLLANQWKKK
jgi:thioredoxin-dependent peroxiredoxin